jgi:hypothetical protein
MVPDSIFQDLTSIKIAIGLVSISLLVSSLALLVLAFSHCRSKTCSGFKLNTISTPDELK